VARAGSRLERVEIEEQVVLAVRGQRGISGTGGRTLASVRQDGGPAIGGAPSRLRERRPQSGAVRMRRVAATESPSLIPIWSPKAPMSCAKKSEKGAKTRPAGTPPADVERKTSLSERWQPLHASAAELNKVRPRSSDVPAATATCVGGAKCAMSRFEFESTAVDATHGVDPERSASARELLGLLGKRLDPQARELLEQRYLMGESTEKIALRLARTPTAIRMRLMRLRSLAKRNSS
jgi:hypothetical protein